jgi:hypothetical protein
MFHIGRNLIFMPKLLIDSNCVQDFDDKAKYSYFFWRMPNPIFLESGAPTTPDF